MSARGRRAVDWLLTGATLAMVGYGLGLRRRASQLAVLPEDARQRDDLDEWQVIAVDGVSVDENTWRGAVAYATANELDVVDLLPADLPVRRWLDTLMLVDPARTRQRPLAIGKGANQAVIARRELIERAGLDAGVAAGPEAMVAATAELKACAPYATGIAVAPTLRASAEPRRSSREVQELREEFTPVLLAARTAGLGLIVALAIRRPRRGIPLAVAYSAVPLVALAGRRGLPRGRDLVRAAVSRVPAELAATTATLRGPWRPPGEESPFAQRRPYYQADLAEGTERFFQAQRSTCPWCGASDVAELLVSKDLGQCKPGRFRLDRCAACGHVFQNPQLTPAGLEFYYRDFYDGLGRQRLETTFSMGADFYAKRAGMVEGHDRPKRWLDVGTGWGHFCLAATEQWTETEFDGIDVGAGVDAAARRGWIHAGYRGGLREIAPELDGDYDVVSLHHYLEHTTDPRAELDAVAALVAPGGHVVIEVPDPDCRWGRILGSRWVMWFQPQHLHLVPRSNLDAALEARGFEIVDRHTHEAHMPSEFLVAAYQLIDGLAPDPRLPWGPPATPTAYLRRALGLALVGPLMVLGGTLDQLFARTLRGDDWSNAYRVLARRTPDDPVVTWTATRGYEHDGLVPRRPELEQ